MRATAKYPISTGDGKGGKLIIPKNTVGTVIAISNAPKTKAAFPNADHKIDGYYYIVKFPEYTDEILCTKEQLDLS
jgi:hypothetical protein